MSRALLSLTALVVLLWAPSARAGLVSDPGFGTGGRTFVSVGEIPAGGGASFVPDLLGGGVTVTATSDQGEGVVTFVRLRGDGSRDPRYGTGGELEVHTGGSSAEVLGVVRQSSGDLVVLLRSAPYYRAKLVRVTPAGTLDPSFGDASSSSLSSDVGGLTLDAHDRLLLAAGPTAETRRVLRLTSEGRSDPSFGDGGSVHLNAGTGIAVAPGDDRLLVGLNTPLNAPAEVERLTADGRPDPDFGANGIAEIQGMPDGAAQLRGSADGRVLVFDHSVLTMLGSDGTPLSGFGTDGAIGGTTSDAFLDAAFDSLGRPLVLENIFSSTTFADVPRVYRLGADGTREATFGTDGYTPDLSVNPWHLSVGPLGRFWLSGYVNAGAPAPHRYGAAAVDAFTSRGDLDSSWGIGGEDSFAVGHLDLSAPLALATDEEHRILAAGSTVVADQSRFLLTRLSSDGRADPSYGTAGVVLGPAGMSLAAAAYTPAGAAVLAANTPDGNGVQLMRLDADGNPDSHFGEDGSAQLPGEPGGTVTSVAKVLLAPDGGAVIVARSGGHDVAVLRTDAAGAPVGSWGSDGWADAGSLRGEPLAAGLTPDGGLVVALSAGDLRDGGVSAVRFTADGSLDSAYGTGGLETVPVASLFGPSAAAVLPDGAVLAASTPEQYTADALGVNLLKLTPGGAPDSDFAPDGLRRVPYDWAFARVAQIRPTDDGGLVLAISESGSDFQSLGGYTTAAIGLHADGSPDESYGPGGHVQTGEGTAVATASTPSGGLIVLGHAMQLPLRFELARLLPPAPDPPAPPTGTDSTTDGGAGTSTTPPPASTTATTDTTASTTPASSTTITTTPAPSTTTTSTPAASTPETTAPAVSTPDPPPSTAPTFTATLPAAGTAASTAIGSTSSPLTSSSATPQPSAQAAVTASPTPASTPAELPAAVLRTIADRALPGRGAVRLARSIGHGNSLFLLPGRKASASRTGRVTMGAALCTDGCTVDASAVIRTRGAATARGHQLVRIPARGVRVLELPLPRAALSRPSKLNVTLVVTDASGVRHRLVTPALTLAP